MGGSIGTGGLDSATAASGTGGKPVGTAGQGIGGAMAGTGADCGVGGTGGTPGVCSGVPGQVACGASCCDAPERCAAEVTGFHTQCFSAFTCRVPSVELALVTVQCDGPEDCPAGEVCCWSVRGSDCSTSCSGPVVCHADNDCAAPLSQCVPSHEPADAGPSCCSSYLDPWLPSCATPVGIGLCSCPNGGALCGGQCTDISSDPAHCGGCGIGCLGGGACCGGACVDKGRDPKNCAACGHSCAGTDPCIGGACGPCNCPNDGACCGSTTSCFDLQTDSLNCGICGAACPLGFSCSSGACIPNCAGPQARCGNGCVDALTDPLNCGHCSIACPQGTSCAAGACTTTATCELPGPTTVATDAGAAVPLTTTLPFSSTIGGGPVAPTASVVVTTYWLPQPLPDDGGGQSYYLPVFFWGLGPNGPWTVGGTSGGGSGIWTSTIPPQRSPAQVYFYVSVNCGNSVASAPSPAGVYYSYSVR
jgi:stigma-specific protein Stig1